MKLQPNNSQYAGMEDNYLLMNHWFANWMGAEAPMSGYKIHVSVHPNYAEITARSVLPKLIQMRIAHKVIKNLSRYIEFQQTANHGKFITIYTSNLIERDQVVASIDEELAWMLGANARGTVPTTRSSNHTEAEQAIGRSGLLYWRVLSGGD